MPGQAIWKSLSEEFRPAEPASLLFQKLQLSFFNCNKLFFSLLKRYLQVFFFPSDWLPFFAHRAESRFCLLALLATSLLSCNTFSWSVTGRCYGVRKLLHNLFKTRPYQPMINFRTQCRAQWPTKTNQPTFLCPMRAILQCLQCFLPLLKQPDLALCPSPLQPWG